MKIVIEPGDKNNPGVKIHQECFCRCETLKGRTKGFCKDFKTRGHALPKKIGDMLYPPEEKKAKFLFKKSKSAPALLPT